jgi:serine/threonine protein kinase
MAYGGWEPIGEPLGEGGQGKVYKARSPERNAWLLSARQKAFGRLLRLTGNIHRPEELPEFARDLVELGLPDGPEHLGALKVFKIPPDDPEEAQRAHRRLESEIAALRKVIHPGILRLLAANADAGFIVTEYHPGGTLDKHLSGFRGEALTALEAFKPLVEAVAEIQKQGVVHRDVKPENIFVANDGRLVLGDFGIVFFQDTTRRWTKTYGERVGSHWWMAAWAYEARRLEEVDGRLDVYPLGKVLWSMVAGRNGFAREEWGRPENDLEKIFPGDEAMPLINGILSRSVVREEKDCLASADDLFAQVSDAIAQLRSSAERPSKGPWRCRACGIGGYIPQDYFRIGTTSQQGMPAQIGLRIHVCDHCQHLQLFRA